MQFVWLYIDDLAGKGIGMWVIAQLMFYAMVSIIPLALPLAVLLASIMTFGNLGESYELIAAKAAGISIWRIFTPMFVILIFLSIFAFIVSNTFIPKAVLKQKSLLYDIRQQKPALLIKEGVFYNGIDGINMRIGRKDVETGEMFDIVIYDNRASLNRPVVLVAKRGVMRMSDDDRYLFFTLYDGVRYEEMDKEQSYQVRYPHNRLIFAEEEVVFDLLSFSFNRSDESLFKDGYQMLNIQKLAAKMDTLIFMNNEKMTLVQPYYDTHLKINDSSLANAISYSISDTVTNLLQLAGWRSRDVIANALNNARNIKSMQEYVLNEARNSTRQILRYNIEWHKKFTLSVACIIMFFIGAPFGVIIRKGGFGMPLVISVLLYIVFHILSIVGDKMVKSETSSPIAGVWLPIYVLLPIGVFLTYQAANDSGLFDFSAWKKLFIRRKHA
jgi:lipopolysaccharide export system permease protein